MMNDSTVKLIVWASHLPIALSVHIEPCNPWILLLPGGSNLKDSGRIDGSTNWCFPTSNESSTPKSTSMERPANALKSWGWNNLKGIINKKLIEAHWNTKFHETIIYTNLWSGIQTIALSLNHEYLRLKKTTHLDASCTFVHLLSPPDCSCFLSFSKQFNLMYIQPDVFYVFYQPVKPSWVQCRLVSMAHLSSKRAATLGSGECPIATSSQAWSTLILWLSYGYPMSR